MTLLHDLIRKKDIEKVKALLDQNNFDLNTLTDDAKEAKYKYSVSWRLMQLPLFVAVEYDQLGIAALLLNKGASPYIEDASSGFTPIKLAVEKNNCDMVFLLINFNDDFLSDFKRNSENLIEFAELFKRDKEIISLLKAISKKFPLFTPTTTITQQVEKDKANLLKTYLQDTKVKSSNSLEKFVLSSPATTTVFFSRKPPLSEKDLVKLPADTFSYYIERARQVDSVVVPYRYLPNIIYSQDKNKASNEYSQEIEDILNHPRKDLCIAYLDLPKGYAGHGLYTTKFVHKGELLGIYEGVELPWNSAQNPKWPSCHQRGSIDGKYIGGMMSFINNAPYKIESDHLKKLGALEFNVEVRGVKHNGRYYYAHYAYKDIPAFHQLLNCYGSMTNSMDGKDAFYFTADNKLISSKKGCIVEKEKYRYSGLFSQEKKNLVSRLAKDTNVISDQINMNELLSKFHL